MRRHSTKQRRVSSFSVHHAKKNLQSGLKSQCPRNQSAQTVGTLGPKQNTALTCAQAPGMASRA